MTYHHSSVVSSKVRLFADDCLIYRNIKNKDQIALQKDLHLLENWGNTWGMRFNAAKCNIMRVSRTRDPNLFNYSLTGQVLEEVMDAKYLGVTLSNDLEWSKHIAIMTNKANSKISFLHHNLKGCSEKLNSLRTSGGIRRPRTHRHADERRQLPPYDKPAFSDHLPSMCQCCCAINSTLCTVHSYAIIRIIKHRIGD